MIVTIFALVIGNAFLVACGSDASMTSGVAMQGVNSPSEVGSTSTTLMMEDDDESGDGQLALADIERVDAIDECLLGLWQADNASWSAALGGLSVTGINQWLLLGNGLSFDNTQNFQIGGAVTLDMFSQGSWAVQDGQIRWDSYTVSSDATFDIPGVGSIDVDLRDRSAIESVVSVAGVRSENILDFSAEVDSESENGPWIASYTCEGERLVLNRGGQSMVYYLVERW